jgi:hypothetical protein
MKKLPHIALAEKQSNPVKILLHMVQVGDDWAGKVTCFTSGEEYIFNDLDDLFGWLRGRRKKAQRGPAPAPDDGER